MCGRSSVWFSQSVYLSGQLAETSILHTIEVLKGGTRVSYARFASRIRMRDKS